MLDDEGGQGRADKGGGLQGADDGMGRTRRLGRAG